MTRPERRRVVRDPEDHYDGFTDRRQPDGVVATWVAVTGGHLVRGRVDYGQLARVLRARLRAGSRLRGEGWPCST